MEGMTPASMRRKRGNRPWEVRGCQPPEMLKSFLGETLRGAWKGWVPWGFGVIYNYKFYLSYDDNVVVFS